MSHYIFERKTQTTRRFQGLQLKIIRRNLCSKCRCILLQVLYLNTGLRHLTGLSANFRFEGIDNVVVIKRSLTFALVDPVISVRRLNRYDDAKGFAQDRSLRSRPHAIIHGGSHVFEATF